jgi:hypothetical protein
MFKVRRHVTYDSYQSTTPATYRSADFSLSARAGFSGNEGFFDMLTYTHTYTKCQKSQEYFQFHMIPQV